MTDRMFERTWSLLKESNPWKSRYPHRGTPKLNDDIDAAVDNVMDDQKFPPYEPQKHQLIHRMISILQFKIS